MNDPTNQAGKGDKQRPVNKRQFDSCPIWDNIGPDARKQAGTQRKGKASKGKR